MPPLLSLLAGPLATALGALLRRHTEQRLSEAALRAEVERTVAETLAAVERDLAAARRDVLLAELTGAGWLRRNWRPLVALLAFLSYWYVIVIVPHLVSWGIMAPPRFGEAGLENLNLLTVISVGGYMGARTAEKIAGLLRGPR